LSNFLTSEAFANVLAIKTARVVSVIATSITSTLILSVQISMLTYTNTELFSMMGAKVARNPATTVTFHCQLRFFFYQASLKSMKQTRQNYTDP
jgi:hypothetical protein